VHARASLTVLHCSVDPCCPGSWRTGVAGRSVGRTRQLAETAAGDQGLENCSGWRESETGNPSSQCIPQTLPYESCRGATRYNNLETEMPVRESYGQEALRARMSTTARIAPATGGKTPILSNNSTQLSGVNLGLGDWVVSENRFQTLPADCAWRNALPFPDPAKSRS